MKPSMAIRPLRVVLYEGAGSRPLPVPSQVVDLHCAVVPGVHEV